MKKPDTKTLMRMLSTRRPAGSKSEKGFIRDFIWPLGMQRDTRGNLYKIIGENPVVMWSAHTDSVHRKQGEQGVKLEGGKLMLATGSKSNCLGADDAAGCWLLREMILANRPGLYIFHRSEECGGLGSRYIAANTPDLVKGIKYAIAFDRRGTKDVITFQSSGRCCSDNFATELAKRLNERETTGQFKYKPCENGIFTDTANYTRLIPECTNVSVGYENEHTSREVQDIPHLLRLRNVLIKLDVAGLPCERDPSKHESRWSGYGGYYGRHYEPSDYWDWEGGGGWEYGYRHKSAGREMDDGASVSTTVWCQCKGYYRLASMCSCRKPRKDSPSAQLAGLLCEKCQKYWRYCACDGNPIEPSKRPNPWQPPQQQRKAIPHIRTIRDDDSVGGQPWTPNTLETIKRNPEAVLKVLDEYGITEAEIIDGIYKYGGALHYN